MECGAASIVRGSRIALIGLTLACVATVAQSRELPVDEDPTISVVSGFLPAGSVSVSRESFEDVVVRAEVDCEAECDFGVLLNADPVEGGWEGFYARVLPTGIELGTATVSETGSVSGFRAFEHEGSGFGRTVAQNMPRNGGPLPPAPSRPAVTPNLGINTFEVVMDGDVFSAVLNGQRLPTYLAPLSEGRAYGPVVFVTGSRPHDVHFATAQDGLTRRLEAPRTESPFQEQRLTNQYIAEAITYGDFNNDGVLDVSAGPFWYEGPDFVTAHEVYLAGPLGPMEVSTSYHAIAGDFTGDGHVDIVQAGPPGMPASFYVNPGNESRRWDRHEAFTGFSTETLLGEDLDGDGNTELIFGQRRRLVIARPDPTGSDKPWITHQISPDEWTMPAHGVGTGDIDGDGRTDILVSNGWWRQPATGIFTAWEFHPVQFGDVSPGDDVGGTAQMFAYDVDGDGLNDVVTSLAPHGFGIGWFRQTRDANGRISFIRNEIMGDDWPPTGGPVFSQPHALAIGDINGDGLTDFVSGKRWWAHRDGLKDPDGRGQPVVYWFELIRDASGARFEPHLVNNNSGVGTAIAVVDLNGDGRDEILTANRNGAFVFHNRP